MRTLLYGFWIVLFWRNIQDLRPRCKYVKEEIPRWLPSPLIWCFSPRVHVRPVHRMLTKSLSWKDSSLPHLPIRDRICPCPNADNQTLKMCFSKCVSQNVFLKMYFSSLSHRPIDKLEIAFVPMQITKLFYACNKISLRNPFFHSPPTLTQSWLALRKSFFSSYNRVLKKQ